MSGTSCTVGLTEDYIGTWLKASGKPMPLLYADIALGDERLDQNRWFRETMAATGIPLRYAEWAGKHSWLYFQVHSPEGLRFMSEHLAR